MDAIKVRYTNWRGETADRIIKPLRLWWGNTEWHPESQWMIEAEDVEKGALRDFALADMVFKPEALAASPEVAKMVADAETRGMERAAVIADRHLSKVEINDPLWHEGQDWAAESIALAIRKTAPMMPRDEAQRVLDANGKGCGPVMAIRIARSLLAAYDEIDRLRAAAIRRAAEGEKA